MDEVRIQKFLSEAGVASRRKSEEYISQGRVKVNGEVITQMGLKVKKTDNIEFDGKRVFLQCEKVYILLNKPIGYVSTANDQFGRQTVVDLINVPDKRIYPVGRLDYDTSGLIILTNDGDFTYKVTHPKHEIEKTYIARIQGLPDSNKLNSFKKGLNIENYITAPSKIKILKSDRKNSIAEIKIHEGKNRQVRKMCESIGHPVITLKRVAIGNLVIGDLREGQWRNLKPQEVKQLLDITS